MTCLTVHHGFRWPSTGVFLCCQSAILSPRAAFLAVRVFSFVLVSLRKGLCLSTCTFLCIVSLRVRGFYLRCWAEGTFPMDSGCLIFPMKRWSGSWLLFIGFFLSIARAAWGCFYLKTNHAWLQKKKKKKKTDQGIGSSRNHLSTFLYSRYCNTITLYSLYLHCFARRA